jgi:uncharacterized membrane protein YdjX (TVP38/TMEM64 family)
MTNPFPAVTLGLKQHQLRFLLRGLFASGVVILPLPPSLSAIAAHPLFALVPDWLGQFQDRLVDTLAWIDGLGAIAPMAFIGLYIIVTIAFLPASIVTLGAGVVFGVFKGTLLVFVGAMLGAIFAFLIGRYLARDWISQKIVRNQKFKAIDEAIAREGRKIIFLIRLSPVFPFNLLNYALGLTKVSLPDYILGTVGIIPGTIMYVYLGSLAGSLAMLGTDSAPSNPAITWAIRLLSLVATIAVTWYVTRISQQTLKTAIPIIETNSSNTP